MPPAAPTPPAYARRGLVPVLLAAAALAAYHGTFDVPFVLDDLPSIVENPTIRSLWPLPLTPPSGGGLTVEARPILNLSFALNYAASGLRVWSYHLVNLAIHVANACLLFGIVRRTAAAPAVGGAVGSGTSFALAVALLFTVHPLQTESVTYVVQRAESLCAFFYLLTLYAFIRGSEGTGVAWPVLSVGACALGMASKEVMVSAPLMVLLYDRAFRAGGVAAALRLHKRYYAALASTWVLLAALVVGFGARGGSAGFAAGIPWPAYVLTQIQATVSYLKLALWPRPLVFDYGTSLVASLGEVFPQAVVCAGLVGATGLALVRRPAAGFLGAWFLAVLAPTALVPVATQTVAEHRMYLALAPLLVLIGVLVRRAAGPRAAGLAAAAVAAAILLTVQRNRVYETPLALWADTAAKRPGNTRARNNLALALAEAGRREEAVEHLHAALRIEPGAVEFHNNLATVYADLGRFPEALAEIDAVLAAVPDLAEAHDTRGHVAERMGRVEEAVRWYESAVQRKPTLAESHRKLGRLLVAAGRREEGRRHLAEAVRLRPDDVEAAAALSAR